MSSYAASSSWALSTRSFKGRAGPVLPSAEAVSSPIGSLSTSVEAVGGTTSVARGGASVWTGVGAAIVLDGYDKNVL
jgi:hypothetical protein